MDVRLDMQDVGLSELISSVYSDNVNIGVNGPLD